MKFTLGSFFRIGLSVVLLAALTGVAGAQSLAKPKGLVILSISGNISQHNAGDVAEFDAAMLDAMTVTQFSTTTPWHKNSVAFAGPSLQSVLTAVGAKGKVLRMQALNDYEIKVPFDDAAEFTPVLARMADGVALTIRTKGPLFMIYPFDSKPKLKNDTYYSRSIWQLRKIVVE